MHFSAGCSRSIHKIDIKLDQIIKCLCVKIREDFRSIDFLSRLSGCNHESFGQTDLMSYSSNSNKFLSEYHACLPAASLIAQRGLIFEGTEMQGCNWIRFSPRKEE